MMMKPDEPAESYEPPPPGDFINLLFDRLQKTLVETPENKKFLDQIDREVSDFEQKLELEDEPFRLRNGDEVIGKIPRKTEPLTGSYTSSELKRMSRTLGDAVCDMEMREQVNFASLTGNTNECENFSRRVALMYISYARFLEIERTLELDGQLSSGSTESKMSGGKSSGPDRKALERSKLIEEIREQVNEKVHEEMFGLIRSRHELTVAKLNAAKNINRISITKEKRMTWADMADEEEEFAREFDSLFASIKAGKANTDNRIVIKKLTNLPRLKKYIYQACTSLGLAIIQDENELELQYQEIFSEETLKREAALAELKLHPEKEKAMNDLIALLEALNFIPTEFDLGTRGPGNLGRAYAVQIISAKLLEKGFSMSHAEANQLWTTRKGLRAEMIKRINLLTNAKAATEQLLTCFEVIIKAQTIKLLETENYDEVSYLVKYSISPHGAIVEQFYPHKKVIKKYKTQVENRSGKMQVVTEEREGIEITMPTFHHEDQFVDTITRETMKEFNVRLLKRRQDTQLYYDVSMKPQEFLEEARTKSRQQFSFVASINTLLKEQRELIRARVIDNCIKEKPTLSAKSVVFTPDLWRKAMGELNFEKFNLKLTEALDQLDFSQY